ncbi:Abi family protein [Paenarthrobacter sp. NPDC058040]|uniref:Abi family protein n=1 Tax=unclassified Paenarthrobacter TaxID=2634190 RepID=UPI0036DBD328
MGLEYTKEFKEREELLRQLEDRGLAVPDRAAALTFLTRVGYFRSGAYRYVFREFLPPQEVDSKLHQYRSDDYVSGAGIGDVMALEAFDSRLLRVCQDGLLDFEVRLRAAIAHTLAAKDIAAHASREFLDEHSCDQPRGQHTKFDAWTTTWQDAVRAAAEDEDFIKHHVLKYPRQPVPIWAVTEVLSFGSLPYLFELMQTPDARAVARMFGFAHPRRFGAVIRTMVDFRNVCAHGARLFNRSFKRAISIGAHDTDGVLLAHLNEPGFTATPKGHQRLYIYAAVLAFMLRSHTAGTNWHLSFKTQVKKFDITVRAPDGSALLSPEASMGFPLDWLKLDLWQ